MTYAKEGGLAFPCVAGQTWTVSRAVLHVGPFPSALPASACVFVDPPWSQGVMSTYYGKAGIPRTSEPYAAFLARLVATSVAASRSCMFEIGSQHMEDLGGLVADAIGSYPYLYRTTYYRKHRCYMVATRACDAAEGTDEWDTPAVAIGAWTRPGELVCDPCSGRGLTAVTALEMGRAFVGWELNPYRASVTLRKLRDLTGEEPHEQA
jgi:hypothetical protein